MRTKALLYESKMFWYAVLIKGEDGYFYSREPMQSRATMVECDMTLVRLMFTVSYLAF